MPGSDWVLSAPVAVRVAFSYSVLHRVRHSYICLSVRCSQTQQPPYWLPQCRGVFDGVSGADVRSSSGIGRGKDHVGKRWRVLRKYISFVPEIANRELPAGGHFHCFRCYRETGLVESMIGEISHRLIDDANDCSSPTSPLAKAKPHKLTSSCSPSFEKGAHERLRAGCNGGNSWNCFERKILDFTGMTSRFAANGTEGLPKRPTKRGPEALPLCGSHKQLKVRVCWTAGPEGSQPAGALDPVQASLACVLTT